MFMPQLTSLNTSAYSSGRFRLSHTCWQWVFRHSWFWHMNIPQDMLPLALYSCALQSGWQHSQSVFFLCDAEALQPCAPILHARRSLSARSPPSLWPVLTSICSLMIFSSDPLGLSRSTSTPSKRPSSMSGWWPWSGIPKTNAFGLFLPHGLFHKS